MAEQQSKQPVPIYQLKITLRDIIPPIARTLQIKGNCNLGKLHTYIQGVMGWENCHLHEFKVKGKSYQDEEQVDYCMDEDDICDESKHYLNRLVKKREKFEYIYDFGDCWEHNILVEKIIQPEEGVYYPICISGERACPPEDCGGSWGYEELIQILNDPKHEEHESYAEWVGEEFSSEKFDLKEANDMLDNIKSFLREPKKHY